MWEATTATTGACWLALQEGKGIHSPNGSGRALEKSKRY
ncbi:uncharacterized protein RAG0_02014 [Rhynchosporium agropyri]|uniref:Uncharacterized protein n=2 Tax=Rhynchosporium TaxID=38037 RepID=A0A1E1MVX2_RHYSE|nr:uncharacterized protein RAG0_02014 [Rhynchosporium agropyri]CZT53231.1 uncharacterized protein RSE6_14703 [Rhynchosporium secalis]